MVEGKDQPQELGTPEFAGYGKTAGLMLRMLKSYFGTGKYVILDSGFCILKALIKLKRHGIFACDLIKKQRFWPTGVPGKSIDQYMAGRKVGDVDDVQGTMEDMPYNLWAMNDPD